MFVSLDIIKKTVVIIPIVIPTETRYILFSKTSINPVVDIIMIIESIIFLC